MQKNKRGQKLKAGGLDKEISYLLADKRKRANLNQNEVAEKIGLTLQQYQKYETAINKTPISTLFKIFDILGMSEKEKAVFWEKVGEKHNELNK